MKPYVTPSLSCLGTVRELTLAQPSGGNGSQKNGPVADTGNGFPTKKK
jgi:hypothetical protein